MSYEEAKKTFFSEYNIDESQRAMECLSFLNKNILNSFWDDVKNDSLILIKEIRKSQKNSSIEKLFKEFEIGSKEGMLLIELAEAIIRVPDYYTTLKLIEDKMSQGDWSKHIGKDKDFIVNLSSLAMKWGEKYLKEKEFENLWDEINKKLGAKFVHFLIKKIVKMTLNNYVLGTTISNLKIKSQLKKFKDINGFSINLFFEPALTKMDAEENFKLHMAAIRKWEDKNMFFGKKITLSLRLSSLFYNFRGIKIEDVFIFLIPKLLILVKEARLSDINVVLEAEESDKLDLIVAVFEKLLRSKETEGWDGLGITIQSYNKRAVSLLDLVKEMAIKYNKKVLVRLVKGDSFSQEIENSQFNGELNYQVFTRKESTDISYLACAYKMFMDEYYRYITPCFGTHNINTIKSIQFLSNNKEFILEKIKGVGDKVYKNIIIEENINLQIYAPVGIHNEMGEYFKKRLTENSSGNSFINQLEHKEKEDDELAVSPVNEVINFGSLRNPEIPLPCFDKNSNQCRAINLNINYRNEFLKLINELDKFAPRKYLVHSVIFGRSEYSGNKYKHYSTVSLEQEIAEVIYLSDAYKINDAVKAAKSAFKKWNIIDVEKRANIVLKLAKLLEENRYQFYDLCIRETGRSYLGAIEEIKQAVDYCYIQSKEVVNIFKDKEVEDTKNYNKSFSYEGKGVVACLNDDVLRFSMIVRQIVANLLCGNTVILKPNKKNVVMTYNLIQLLYKAGVPSDVVQFIIGFSQDFENILVLDDDIDLITYRGPESKYDSFIKLLIENKQKLSKIYFENKQNGIMIVDSTVNIKEVVNHLIYSKYKTLTGDERLVKVYLQEDIKDKFLNLLINRLNILSEKSGNLDKELSVDLNENILDVDIQKFKKLKKFSTLDIFFFVFKGKEIDLIIDAINKENKNFVIGLESKNNTLIRNICKELNGNKFYINKPIIPNVSGFLYESGNFKNMLEERSYLRIYCSYKILSISL